MCGIKGRLNQKLWLINRKNGKTRKRERQVCTELQYSPKVDYCIPSATCSGTLSLRTLKEL